MNRVHVGIERIVFWHVTDSLADLKALVSDVVAENAPFARRRLNQAEDGLQKSRFSRTVLAEQTRGTVWDVDVQIVKGHMRAVGFGERRGLDDGFIRHGSLREVVVDDDP